MGEPFVGWCCVFFVIRIIVCVYFYNKVVLKVKLAYEDLVSLIFVMHNSVFVDIVYENKLYKTHRLCVISRVYFIMVPHRVCYCHSYIEKICVLKWTHWIKKLNRYIIRMHGNRRRTWNTEVKYKYWKLAQRNTAGVWGESGKIDSVKCHEKKVTKRNDDDDDKEDRNERKGLQN